MSRQNDPKFYTPYVSDEESADEEEDYESSYESSEDESPQTKFINFLTGKSEVAGARPLTEEAQRQLLEKPTIDYSYLNLPSSEIQQQPKFSDTTDNSTTLHQ